MVGPPASSTAPRRGAVSHANVNDRCSGPGRCESTGRAPPSTTSAAAATSGFRPRLESMNECDLRIRRLLRLWVGIGKHTSRPAVSQKSLQQGSGFIQRFFGSSAIRACFVFTARRNARIASAVIQQFRPSVHPSVRLSHAGIVSKRLNVSRYSLHCQIAICV